MSFVGPVIVKRLAMIFGAAAAVALLTWGIRRIIRGAVPCPRQDHRRTSGPAAGT